MATLRATVRPSGTSPQRATTAEVRASPMVTAKNVVGTRRCDGVSTAVTTTNRAPNANTSAEAIANASGGGPGSSTSMPCSSSAWAARASAALSSTATTRARSGARPFSS